MTINFAAAKAPICDCQIGQILQIATGEALIFETINISTHTHIRINNKQRNIYILLKHAKQNTRNAKDLSH